MILISHCQDSSPQSKSKDKRLGLHFLLRFEEPKPGGWAGSSTEAVVDEIPGSAGRAGGQNEFTIRKSHSRS